jgi:hypothetical protein
MKKFLATYKIKIWITRLIKLKFWLTQWTQLKKGNCEIYGKKNIYILNVIDFQSLYLGNYMYTIHKYYAT